MSATSSSPSSKKRLYNEDYIKYGFTYIMKNHIQLPQCVVCHAVLSNDALRPVRLERHLITTHPAVKNKPKEFFVAKKTSLNKMKLDSTGGIQQQNEKIIEVSYKIALLIAKQKKPHTIGESLVKPSILTAVQIILGDESQKKMNQISLSNNTIKRRIDEMALDMKNQLVEQLKNSQFFSLQCDESTDVAQCAQLIVYCRFISGKTIAEELLFSKELKTTTKGTDLLSAICEFFQENTLLWENVVGICTDGAPAMIGSRSGFIRLAKDKNPSIIGSHCMIHRQALASKTLPEELKRILTSCIKIVNTIKSSALNTRVFEALCTDLSAEHKALLFHTEVRWLSKGNMLDRLYELKSEIEIFLISQGKNEMYETFTAEKFMFSLAYLADFFEAINTLNLKLQGRNTNIMTASDSVQAFLEKIQLWKKRLNSQQPNFSSFRRLNELIVEERCDLPKWKEIITQHLDELYVEFKRYFPDISNESWQCKVARSPFTVDVDILPGDFQEEAIELKNDSNAKDQFETITLEEFWVKYHPIYPQVANEVLKVLLQFSSTYLCESGFSNLAIIKSKHRNRLDVEADLRCALSSLSPNIKKLTREKQYQPAH